MFENCCLLGSSFHVLSHVVSGRARIQYLHIHIHILCIVIIYICFKCNASIPTSLITVHSEPCVECRTSKSQGFHVGISAGKGKMFEQNHGNSWQKKTSLNIKNKTSLNVSDKSYICTSSLFHVLSILYMYIV